MLYFRIPAAAKPACRDSELNPFCACTKVHSSTTLEKMSKSKAGALNPMFKKEKSKEFIAHMNKDRSGYNNPMFGKKKSEETLVAQRSCATN